MTTNINQLGLELIKHHETLALQPCQSSAGGWIIGYGLRSTASDQIITEEEAEARLLEELTGLEQGLTDAIKVPLNENEFSALVSFAFNITLPAFLSSTVLKRLNKGDRQGALAAMDWWTSADIDGELTFVPALAARRASEKALFLEPLVSSRHGPPLEEAVPEGVHLTPEEEVIPRRQFLSESRSIQAALGAAGFAALETVLLIAAKTDTSKIGNPFIQRSVETLQALPYQTHFFFTSAIFGFSCLALFARWDDWRRFRR